MTTASEDEDGKLGDVNGDGSINSTDALLILKYAANLIHEFAKAQA